jgi:hypothetical protein
MVATVAMSRGLVRKRRINVTSMKPPRRPPPTRASGRASRYGKFLRLISVSISTAGTEPRAAAAKLISRFAL